jgi:hypothetical protein
MDLSIKYIQLKLVYKIGYKRIYKLVRKEK